VLARAGMVLLCALALTAAAAERDQPLAPDTVAPDVALSDQHGKPFRLAEALKQHELVVLAFYVKAFTGG
jgi:cytochrome oxidase Cu insertion factor (SCO1/SenC/PrrC family)